MKILSLLAFAYCAIVVVLSEAVDQTKQALLARASAQLERLDPYRKSSRASEKSLGEQWRSLESTAMDPAIKALSEQQAFEIYRILPQNLQQDIANKVGGNRAMLELLANSKYMALMQERIKRSGGVKRETYDRDGYESPPDAYPQEEYGGYHQEPYGDHYGGYPQSSGSDSGGIIKGSASLIGGIAKGIIGGLVSASGSASKGSSSISASSSQSSAQSSASSSGDYNKPKPEYGPVYSYGDKAFDVWDFKKAIISTLMQAVKAISGGVIALKGQLLKGSGYLVSTKGKIITKAGDAVTNLGRSIAKSATQPPPTHPGYAYDHLPQGHEETYDGPPPSIDEYVESNDEYHGHSSYGSPSDVGDEAGLLIVKPTKPDDHDQHTVDLDVEKPPLPQPEDNYHGPPPELPAKEIENGVVESLNDHRHPNQADHAVVASNPHDRPSTTYDISVQQLPLHDPSKGHGYAAYPATVGGSPLNHHTPISVQQSVEYTPIHVKYAVPNGGSLDLPSLDTSSNDLSVYGSLSIGVDPEIDSVKISTVNQHGGIELPKLQPLTTFHNVPHLSNPYSTLQEPLKIPLLNSYPATYWQSEHFLQPFPNFDMHSWYRRRSSAQKRRSVSQLAQRTRPRRG